MVIVIKNGNNNSIKRNGYIPVMKAVVMVGEMAKIYWYLLVFINNGNNSNSIKRNGYIPVMKAD